MKLRKFYLPLLAALAVLIVWKLHQRAETGVPFFASSEPTQAQPKLPTIKLWLGSKEIVAEIARQPVEIATGMMFRTNMADTEGMIFVFDGPGPKNFYMRNCTVALSAGPGT